MPAVAAYLGEIPTLLYLGDQLVVGAPAPQVITNGVLHGPTELEFTAPAGAVLVLHQSHDYGSGADAVAPTGAAEEWQLVDETKVADNGPMVQVWTGAVETAGEQTVTLAATITDAWVHGHLYVLPSAWDIVDAGAADGGAGFNATAPALVGLPGDILIGSAVKSYHGGSPTWTPPAGMSEQSAVTVTAGEYGSSVSGWETITDGEPGAQVFVSSFSLVQWAASSTLLRRRRAPLAAPDVAPMQPAALVYQNDPGSNIESYEHPGALVVTGRDNYDDPAFSAAAAAGAHVFVYLDAIVRNTIGRYHELLHDTSVHGAATVAWPGLPDANETGPLVDIRVGTFPLAKLEAVLELLIDENPGIDGIFADDLGSRSYFPGIDWDLMSAADQLAYRRGAVAIARVFRAVTTRHDLLLLVNGTWNGGTVSALGGGFPVAAGIGCAFADGAVLENWEGFDPTYRAAYVRGPQWAAGSPRLRGTPLHLAITADPDDRDDWAADGQVAWCAYQSDYDDAAPPWGSFHPI